jgi:hypothetical protein
MHTIMQVEKTPQILLFVAAAREHYRARFWRSPTWQQFKNRVV